MLPRRLQQLKNYSPNTPLIKLDDPWLKPHKVSLFIKRDDLIDVMVSGNKFRKLKYILHRYNHSNYSGIVSFGGPWSNHLHALSVLAKRYDIPFIAVIRGEKPALISDTLSDIIACGTEVHYVARDQYRQMRTLSQMGDLTRHPLLKQWSGYLIIPEGGCTKEALQGVAEIITENEQHFNALYLPCGTGTTLAGLCIGLAKVPDTKLVAIAALKAGTSLQENVRRLLASQNAAYTENWIVDNDYHFGGFAKLNASLIEFINQMYKRTGLVTEPVYSAKTLYALYQHIQQGRFPAGSQIMFLHTGGLQGLRGFKDKGIDVATDVAIPYAAH